MAVDPAFLMYYRHWIVSTAGWDADVRGWYINLLCHQADKPEGLNNDFETLAQLAGVKFSQFDRFKLCWKRTLEAEFQAEENGMLVNVGQKKVIEDRKKYSANQRERGLIGYYIKIARRDYDVSEETADRLYVALKSENLTEKSKEEGSQCFKRTLVALMINANANTSHREVKGKKERGVGEEKKGAEKTDAGGPEILVGPAGLKTDAGGPEILVGPAGLKTDAGGPEILVGPSPPDQPAMQPENPATQSNPPPEKKSRKVVDLSGSNLYRQPVIPDLAQVEEVFVRHGGTLEMAGKFYASNTATGWFLRGSPIHSFASMIPGFIESWQKNEQKDHQKSQINGNKSHNGSDSSGTSAARIETAKNWGRKKVTSGS